MQAFKLCKTARGWQGLRQREKNTFMQGHMRVRNQVQYRTCEATTNASRGGQQIPGALGRQQAQQEDRTTGAFCSLETRKPQRGSTDIRSSRTSAGSAGGQDDRK
eukprot:1159702-Pelagomonas_calceolata.AAC.1